MKRLFALLTVIASSAILFSCGGGSSDDGLPALSAEASSVTKAVGKAVDDAVSAALNSASSPARSAKLANSEEPASGELYNKDGLKITGTPMDLTIEFTDFATKTTGDDKIEHTLKMNGKLNKKTAEGEKESPIQKETTSGSITVIFDGKSHTIVQNYTKSTDHEKKTFTVSGTVTFDGTEGKYEDSGKLDGEGEGDGLLMTIASGVVDGIGQASVEAIKGSRPSSSSFSFAAPEVINDCPTLKPTANEFVITLGDKSTVKFSSKDIVFSIDQPAVQYPNPSVCEYKIVVNSGKVVAGTTEYTFSCTGSRKETTPSDGSAIKTVENYTVTINGKSFPMKYEF